MFAGSSFVTSNCLPFHLLDFLLKYGSDISKYTSTTDMLGRYVAHIAQTLFSWSSLTFSSLVPLKPEQKGKSSSFLPILERVKEYLLSTRIVSNSSSMQANYHVCTHYLSPPPSSPLWLIHGIGTSAARHVQTWALQFRFLISTTCLKHHISTNGEQLSKKRATSISETNSVHVDTRICHILLAEPSRLLSLSLTLCKRHERRSQSRSKRASEICLIARTTWKSQ